MLATMALLLIASLSISPPVPGVVVGDWSAWQQTAGPPHTRDTFGDYLQRVAMARLGSPYFDPPPTEEGERFEVDVDRFQCVSFVELSLATAQCAWAAHPPKPAYSAAPSCWRYRGGQRDGYPSKLHYFSEWLLDAQRKT